MEENKKIQYLNLGWNYLDPSINNLQVVSKLSLFLKSNKVTPMDSLAWMLLLLYLLFATLPLKLLRCANLAASSILLYLIAIIGLSSKTLEDLTSQPIDVLVGNS